MTFTNGLPTSQQKFVLIPNYRQEKAIGSLRPFLSRIHTGTYDYASQKFRQTPKSQASEYDAVYSGFLAKDPNDGHLCYVLKHWDSAMFVIDLGDGSPKSRRKPKIYPASPSMLNYSTTTAKFVHRCLWALRTKFPASYLEMVQCQIRGVHAVAGAEGGWTELWKSNRGQFIHLQNNLRYWENRLPAGFYSFRTKQRSKPLSRP